MLLEKGMPLDEIKIIGGWKSERTVLRYYAIANREKAKKEYQRILNNITKRAELIN